MSDHGGSPTKLSSIDMLQHVSNTVEGISQDLSSLTVHQKEYDHRLLNLERVLKSGVRDIPDHVDELLRNIANDTGVTPKPGGYNPNIPDSANPYFSQYNASQGVPNDVPMNRPPTGYYGYLEEQQGVPSRSPHLATQPPYPGPSPPYQEAAAEAEIQEEFAVIKDSVQHIRLPPGFRTSASRQGLKRQYQPQFNSVEKSAKYVETTVKLLSTLPPSRVVSDLITVQTAHSLS